ncbi:hypothetical protein CLV58_10625 [Spirosoma oryzae]|uniref:Uncharacterized protein n=1 Tax=Spirosoma oryzae TaxID=1469603 RepID=A0A2T0T5A2_9BACT|nr:hypothetical protein [Spirosoma oryzae]PRY40842.1 hypothetical protein CLV58_10625 [Spirosoma oryzae]
MNPIANDAKFLSDATAEAKALFAADAIICIPVYKNDDGIDMTAPILFDGINQASVTKILQASLKQGRSCRLCSTESNQ